MSNTTGRFDTLSEHHYRAALQAMVAGSEYSARAVVDPVGLPVVAIVIKLDTGEVVLGMRPDIANRLAKDIEYTANMAIFFAGFKHLMAESHIDDKVQAGMLDRLSNIMIGHGAEINRLRAENGGGDE